LPLTFNASETATFSSIGFVETRVGIDVSREATRIRCDRYAWKGRRRCACGPTASTRGVNRGAA
jgi:hypothetical protein